MRMFYIIYTLLCTKLVAGSVVERQTATSCQEPFVAVGHQCLFFASFASQNEPEARQLCNSLGGELASILTPTSFQTIVSYIHETGLSEKGFWINGSDEGHEGVWQTSSGEAIPMGTPFWCPNDGFQEPNNFGGIENCVTISPDYYHYYFNDVSCNSNAHPICEQGMSSEFNNSVKEVQCPPFYVEVGGICLAFLTWADLEWEEARQSCHGLSGELATLTDIEQLRAVYLYLHQEGIAQHSFWLGGSDSASEGSWKWTDGRRVPMGTPFWGLTNYNQEPDGGPEENCLSINAYGYHFFQDADCLNLKNPLCLSLVSVDGDVYHVNHKTYRHIHFKSAHDAANQPSLIHHSLQSALGLANNTKLPVKYIQNT